MFFFRGNWWGHAPYKYGTPCSACPASYAGGCRDNLCYKGQCPQVLNILYTYLHNNISRK